MKKTFSNFKYNLNIKLSIFKNVYLYKDLKEGFSRHLLNFNLDSFKLK